MSQLVLSSHAVTRYRTRVAPATSISEARLRLGRFVSMGRHRATPRHWMRDDVRAVPGLTFIYWAAMPEVCALVRDGVVVTVVTRALCCSSHRRANLDLAAAQRPDLRPVVEDRWRWSGDIEEAA